MNQPNCDFSRQEIIRGASDWRRSPFLLFLMEYPHCSRFFEHDNMNSRKARGTVGFATLKWIGGGAISTGNRKLKCLRSRRR